MFENSGNKLKALSKLLFVLGLIATIIAAIAYSITYDRYGDADGFRFWQFLIILISGSFSSYITSLLLYAFGNLVDDASALRSDVKEINYRLCQVYISARTESHDGENPLQENKAGGFFSVYQKADDRRCPQCGLTIHSPQIVVCPRCGTHV
ncbi:MAG: zinc ribbon domain-containing protein [Clostridiales bacterium]|nr:zinc ribbon domain-containing protein [Clostridiales bacterium]